MFHSLLIVDEHGIPVVSSIAMLPRSVSYTDRSFFQYHASHAGSDVQVTGPLRSKSDRSCIVAVTRRIDHPDGSFAGAVVATISCDFFQQFYATVDVGKRGAISLLTEDGVVVVRKPFDPANVGRRIAAKSLVPALFEKSPVATFDMVSTLDGERRIGSIYRLDRYPLTILVAYSTSDALADWRIDALMHSIGVAVLAAIVALLGKGLAVQIRTGQKTETLYRLLADNSTDAIVCIEVDGPRTYVSPSFEALTGWQPEAMIGDFWGHLVHPEDRGTIQEKLDNLGAGESQTAVAYRQLCRDGSYVWMEAGIRLVQDGLNGKPSFIASVRDISERKRFEQQLAEANKELVELTVTDTLTGIANRRRFDEVLDHEWARARRDDAPLSLLLIDVDCFKKYNDHYGHQKGDDCLRRIAETIDGAVYRPGDLAARIGGEEFAVILPRTDATAAALTAERVRQAIQSLRIEHSRGPRGLASVSIGVATSDRLATTKISALIQEADTALYEAKNNGRDRVVAAQRHYALDRSLQQA